MAVTAFIGSGFLPSHPALNTTPSGRVEGQVESQGLKASVDLKSLLPGSLARAGKGVSSSANSFVLGQRQV